MECIIGKTAGFCYGVENAVSKTIKVLEENKSNKVYCIGEIVHNGEVVKRLKNLGLTVIESVDDLEYSEDFNNKVIIRAHGVSKDVYKKLEELNYECLDLTCPNVLGIHSVAKHFVSQDKYIFLMGQKKHPEIIGIYSWCKEQSSIIETEEDIEVALEEYKLSGKREAIIITQTTFSLAKFNEFSDIIKEKIEVEVKNTICNATRKRQDETEKMAKEVECMIIIGGVNSSNTKKLFEISKKYTDAILIETVKDLDKSSLNKYKKIGVMAGASTPKKSIDDVINIFGAPNQN